MVDARIIKNIIRSERVEKFNPYHDRLGRFSTSDSASFMTITTRDPKKQHMADAAVNREKEAQKQKAYSGIDGCECLSDKFKDRLKKYVDHKAEEASLVDDRLGITQDDAIKSISDKCLKNYYSTDPDWDILVQLVDIASDKVVSGAINSYCREKLGTVSKFYAEVDTEMFLDFVDGASWAREKLGSADSLLYVGSPYEELAQKLSGGCWAATITDGVEGTTSMVVEPNVYKPGSTFIKDYKDYVGMHPKNVSSQQIGAHEYAHVFEQDTINKVYGTNNPDSMKASVNHPVAEEIVKRATNSIGESAEDAISKVSLYATSSYGEAFAECIADCYSNGENAAELSKAVFKVATEQMDDVRASLKGRK